MSALVQVNGVPVLSMRLSLPLAGVWWADVVVDGQAPISGSVALEFGDIAFRGTATGGYWADTSQLRIRGGAGGMQKPVGPFSYRQVTLQAAAQDILQAAGERRSPRSDQTLLSELLSFYHYAETQCGVALKQLLDVFEANWRVLPNGDVWLGYESWPTSEPAFELLSTSPHLGRALLSLDGPWVLPGTTLRGKKVSRVEYRLEPGQNLEASLLFSGV